MMSSSTQVHREALQRQTQQDWANREYIELISGSIKVRYFIPLSSLLHGYTTKIYSSDWSLVNLIFICIYRGFLTS